MGARMKKFRWVAIVVGMILVAAVVFCTKGIRLERDEGSSQDGQLVAVQTEPPVETETAQTEEPQDGTADDLAEQVAEDPNLTTIYVYDEATESFGLQDMGWFADIMAKRFGVRLYMLKHVAATRLGDDVYRKMDIAIWDSESSSYYVQAKAEGRLEDVHVSHMKNGKVISIGARSMNKKLCRKIVKYMNSSEAQMEATYGPEKICWSYRKGKAYLTETGARCIVDAGCKLDAGISGRRSFSEGHCPMSYRLGDMSDIDPKTGESYDILEKTRRVEAKAKKSDRNAGKATAAPDYTETARNDKKIGKDVSQISVTYNMRGYRALGTQTLDASRLKQVTEWFDELKLTKRKKPSEKDPDYASWQDTKDNFIHYQLKGGRYKDVIYYPQTEIVQIDKKWYNNSVSVERTPADTFAKGAGSDGTSFYIYGKKYDLRAQDANVKAILYGEDAGADVVVICRLKKGGDAAFIYDRVYRKFIAERKGTHFALSSREDGNTLEDGVYVDPKGAVRDYTGALYGKKIELKKGEKICSLYQPDGKTEWWAMIADIRANDVRNIEIEKIAAPKKDKISKANHKAVAKKADKVTKANQKADAKKADKATKANQKSDAKNTDKSTKANQKANAKKADKATKANQKANAKKADKTTKVNQKANTQNAAKTLEGSKDNAKKVVTE